jgi:hypothetical protein
MHSKAIAVAVPSVTRSVCAVIQDDAARGVPSRRLALYQIAVRYSRRRATPVALDRYAAIAALIVELREGPRSGAHS